jgi:RHS repeat-associated protein
LLSAKRVSDRSLDETYTYDANANRTSSSQLSSQVIGTNNRLLSDSRYEYRYDAAGNLIDRREPATGIHDRYEYDHLNHLTRSQRVSSSGAVLSTVEYRYDALGRRIARTVDSDGAGPVAAASENFVYDGLNVWLDADAAGNVTARYLFGDDIDEPLARYRPGEGTSWYLTDHLGSVRNILNSVGTVVDTIDYDSFGNILSETSPQFGDRYKYTAREWDSQLGLYYYRARLYSPSTGRFTTEDPIGFAGGQVNLTANVGNAPTIYIDPLGLSAEGAATLAWGTRVANAETGALVGGSLGFACGFLEGLYRTGSVEGALDAGANEALIGGGAGAVFGFAGAATSVWARYLNGIFLLGGGALALNHIYQGEDLAIKTIRSACGVIGFGLGFSTFMPTPRVPTKFPNVALPIVDRTFVPKAPVHVLLMEQASRRGFATGQSEAIVWTGTGRGNYWLKRSQRYATENGGKTLEMTDGGKYLDDFDLFGQNSPLSLYEAMEVWELASRQFAIGARGQVRAVVGTIRPSSVFNRIELPELLYNPNVWGIDILFLHPGVGLR